VGDRNKQYRHLRILVSGSAAIEEHGAEEVSKILKVSLPTARKYIRNPEEMKCKQLLKLAQSLHVPIADLRESIRY